MKIQNISKNRREISVDQIRFIFLVSFLLLTLFSLSYQNANINDPILVFVVSSILYVTGVFIFLREAASLNILSPLSVFAVTVVVHFSVFGMLNGSADLEFVNIKNYSHIGVGILFVNLCLFCYIVGYFLPTFVINKSRYEKKDDILYHLKNIPVIRAAYILLILGWVARAWNIAEGGYFKYSYYSSDIELSQRGIIALLSALPDLAAACFFYKYLLSKRRISGFLFSIVIIFSNSIYWVGAGMKQEFIASLLMIFGSWYFLTKKLPSKTSTIFCIIMLFVYLTLNNGYRTAQEASSVEDVRSLQGILKLTGEMVSTPRERDYDGSSGVIRLNLTEPLAGALRLVENDPSFLRDGSDYADAFGSIVPRIFWSDKPSVGSIGNDFGQWTGMLNNPLDTVTSISVTWFGEAFLNFGWLGCLVFFPFGIFSRIFYMITWEMGRSYGVMIYLFSVSYIAYIGSPIGITINSIVKASIFIGAIFFVFNQKSKKLRKEYILKNSLGRT